MVFNFMKSVERGGAINGLIVTQFTFQDFMVPLRDTIGLIRYNVKHFKGSLGKNESRYSLILSCEFCTCIVRISGVPQYSSDSHGVFIWL